MRLFTHVLLSVESPSTASDSMESINKDDRCILPCLISNSDVLGQFEVCFVFNFISEIIFIFDLIIYPCFINQVRVRPWLLSPSKA